MIVSEFIVQVWPDLTRFLPLWQNCKSLWLFFEVLIWILRNFEPNLVTSFDIGQIFIVVNGPMLKDNWAICSLLIYRPKGSVPENAFDDFQSQCRSHFLTVKINFCKCCGLFIIPLIWNFLTGKFLFRSHLGQFSRRRWGTLSADSISCPVHEDKRFFFLAVVVAQLVERSLPIPEDRGSNPVICKKIIYILNNCLLSTVYWKDENKEKRGREWPIF